MSVLPAYMSELFRAYEEMRSVDRVAIDSSLIGTDPKKCHKSVLPFLAWEADVNIDGFSEDIQRKLIDGAFKALQYAGTRGALESAFEGVVDVNVIEWFDYTSLNPYHFKLDLSANNIELTPKTADRIEKIALKRKNVRSVLDEISVSYLIENKQLLVTGCVCEIMMGV